MVYSKRPLMPSLAAVIAFGLGRQLTQRSGRLTQKRHAVRAAGRARHVETEHTSLLFYFYSLKTTISSLPLPLVRHHGVAIAGSVVDVEIGGFKVLRIREITNHRIQIYNTTQ